jgi:hypothetical protein
MHNARGIDAVPQEEVSMAKSNSICPKTNSKELYVAETIVLCLRVQCDAR